MWVDLIPKKIPIWVVANIMDLLKVNNPKLVILTPNEFLVKFKINLTLQNFKPAKNNL